MKHHYAFLDKRVISKLSGLRVAFRRVFDGLQSGIHGSSSQGFNTEFLQHRDYFRGDDVKHIDWRLYGRRERLFIREFQEDTNFRVLFMLDVSRSMSFNSGPYMEKVEYGKRIVSHLSYFLLNQNDQVGLAFFDSSILRYINPSGGRKQINVLIKEMEKQAAGNYTTLHSSLKDVLSYLNKRCMIVLISDFIDPDRDSSFLRYFPVNRFPVLAVKINDPLESTLSCKRYSNFVDLESNRKISADPEIIRKRYLELYEEHQEWVSNCFRSSGCGFFQADSSQRLEVVVLSLLNCLRRSG